MTMRRKVLSAVLVMMAAFAAAGLHGGTDRNSEWNALVDEYLDKVYFPQNPSAATVAGIHAYDAEIEPYSKQEIAEEIRILHQYEQRVSEFSAKGLTPVAASDREFLLGQIRSALLTLETLRPREKNPDVYPSGAANGVYVLMVRQFAPAEDRLRSVVGRERKIPAMLASARDNLSHPPKIFTEIALEQLPGTIAFFESDVPAAFKQVHDEKLLGEFAKSNAEVIAALKDYAAWVKADVLPRSNGDFRLGAANYAKKLQYEEMVDTPLDRLLEIGLADLHKNQAALRQLAKEIEPQKTPREVVAELSGMHPAPDKLMDTFRGTFDGIIAFIQAKQIITIPPGPKPILKETPPFERATTTASMDTPGPFETHATESYFHVTLPAPGDSPEDVASLMAGFNVGTIVTTSVHETYPGHYLQYLWTSRAPSKLRKVFYANTNVEGWAHYTEQMMLDEGYGQPGTGAKDAREAKFIRLGQLQDALLRDARFVVGLQMHTGNMSVEDAKRFFVMEGFQSEKISDIEAKRGTSDPTYLYYTLGKLQILKLREDYRKKMGDAFSLGKFHDEFMGQGFPPIAVVRKAMLGDDSPTL
ncbi:MAG TPA: DUF885 domain-containing protein [Terriglobales bacterium]|nr:DUF885 domain-containing protein [Terriglobales bacterium]